MDDSRRSSAPWSGRRRGGGCRRPGSLVSLSVLTVEIKCNQRHDEDKVEERRTAFSQSVLWWINKSHQDLITARLISLSVSLARDMPRKHKHVAVRRLAVK